MNKLFLILSFAFLLVLTLNFTQAAIAFDSAASATGAAPSLTYAHTVTGSNTLLVVGVSIENAADLVTGITYNGVAMTRVDYQSGNGEGAYMYYLLNPSTGTNNIVISSGGVTAIRASSVSYTGVLQSAQPDASTKQTTAVSNPVTTALNTVADNSWMVSYAQSNGFVVTGSTGTTLRSQVTDKFNAIGDSNAPITPPQSYSMSWSGGSVWNIVQASFKPVITQVLNITMVSPSNGAVISVNPVSSINFTSFYNLSTLAYNLSNATTTVWYSNGTLFNQTTVNISNSTNNLTRVQINNFQVNSYLWNVNVCYRNNTFVNCTFNPINYSFQTSNYTLNNISYNNISYETKSELFYINITAPSIPTNAQFVYNSTTYNANITNTSGGNFTISSIIDIPIGQGANNFYFNFMLGSNMATTNTYVQNVTNTTLFLCSGGATPYINFTGYDEMTLLQLPYSIASSTFTYWLGSGNVTKQLFYSNTTEVPYYTFCLTPQNVTLFANYSYSYQATNYPIRTIINSTITLTNSTRLQNIYLMNSVSGIPVTFQVTNIADQALQNVYATATRNINGINVIVGDGYTGSDGGVTFFVNPLLTYTFTFVATGYDTFTFSTTPSQSVYTITLGGGTVQSNDYLKGINTLISPRDNYLLNNTNYTFSFDLNSTYWTVTQFGFNLRLSNGTIVATNSSNTNGMNVSVLYNTTNQSIIYMDYYWLINGTYVNGTTYWVVFNQSNTEHSVAHFFTDLNSYLNTNMFGIDNFGRSALFFILLFVTVGFLSYKFSFTNPIVISTLIFGVTFFFDVVVGLIPQIRGISNLPTFLAGLILVVSIIREVQVG